MKAVLNHSGQNPQRADRTRQFRSWIWLPVIVLSVLASRGAAEAEPGYTLVWADEFNQDGQPDPRNWSHEHGFVRNHELQWYQPGNAFCDGGLPVIEGRREGRPNPNYQAGSTHWRHRRPTIDYTAASLLTRGKHSWRYGRFEMRARIPTTAGLWPAFWTLGGGGPAAELWRD